MSFHENEEAVALLDTFEVDPERGYLPQADPLERLPAPFAAWEDAAHHLPKILTSNKVRALLSALPEFPLDQLKTDAEWRRAMVLLSYIGQAYIWGEAQAADRLPAVIAKPWYEVATKLGRHPILSYASYALDNWKRFDPNAPIEVGNIALLQNFLGGLDEEWFILIHVDIEAKAGPALTALSTAQRAVAHDDMAGVEKNLQVVEKCLSGMYATMARMPENCDPYIYYHRVRPYIHGWKNNPALPEGVFYEGVDAYEGKHQQFRGETGAQSSIIPAMDAVLGVYHKDDPMKPYLLEMREYMPPKHRQFIEALEDGPSLRQYLRDKNPGGEVMRAYNECVSWVEKFRSLHLEYAASYIHKQAQTDYKNPSKVGTGGTPFMKYLKKHRDETSEHVIEQ